MPRCARQLAVRIVAATAVADHVDLVPVRRLVEERRRRPSPATDGRRTARPSRGSRARSSAAPSSRSSRSTSLPPWRRRSCAQHVGGDVGLGRVDLRLVDDLAPSFLNASTDSRPRWCRSRWCRRPPRRSRLHDFEAVITHRVVPLGVRGREAEGVGIFLGIDQRFHDAGMYVGHLEPRHDRRVASASPEFVGPQIACTFWRLISSCVAFTALVGSPCVSRVTISILRPCRRR